MKYSTQQHRLIKPELGGLRILVGLGLAKANVGERLVGGEVSQAVSPVETLEYRRVNRSFRG